MLRKLKNNKGFTLVEVVVVIAIIAIMAAAFVFSLNNTGSKNDEARQYARTFYYSTQLVMTDLKNDVESGDNTGKINTGYYRLLYLHVSDTGALSNCNYVDSTTIAGFRGLASFANTLDASSTGNLAEVYTSLSKIVTASKYDGYYFALVDDHYRVIETYWSTGDYNSLKATSFVFSGECRVNGNMVGAYPISKSQSGAVMLS